MTSETVQVVGDEGRTVELTPGDEWPLPYRGSRYSIRQIDNHLKVVWQWQDVVVPSTNYPSNTIQAMHAIGKPRGSFCITPHRLIITKIPDVTGQKWRSTYVGKYTSDIDFGDLSPNASELKTGMYWTGFPFNGGETWSFSPKMSAFGLPTWKHEGVTFASTRHFRQLYSKYMEIRRSGGRFYITEQGHIWMNLRDGQASSRLSTEFMNVQKDQVRSLYAERKVAVLQLLKFRIEATNCRPIYLGNIRDFDEGVPPWTYFTKSSVRKFGTGPETEVDDDDTNGD